LGSQYFPPKKKFQEDDLRNYAHGEGRVRKFRLSLMMVEEERRRSWN